MNNNLTTTNQNAKLALEKSKNLIAITKHLLANKHALATPLTEFSYRLHITTGHSNFVTSVAFSPDGKTIVSGSHDTTIRLWDVKSQKEIACLEGDSYYSVTSIAFSPDGKTIVYGSLDDTIRLWDAQSGREKQIAYLKYLLDDDYYDGYISYFTFSPDGQIVVVNITMNDNVTHSTHEVIKPKLLVGKKV